MAATATPRAPFSRGARARQRAFRHPGYVVLAGFLATIGVGTILLLLPISAADGRQTSFVDALFTATSAITTTGLDTVNGPAHWSNFGDGVIAVLIQIGGLGILTSASLFFMAVAHRIGLRRRLATQMEVRADALGGLRQLVLVILKVAVLVELTVALALTATFWLRYDERFLTALWHGGFHSISAFNNAGTTLFPDGLDRFAGDPFVLVPLIVGCTIGALGFPVWAELWRRRGPVARWSIHTKLTLVTTAVMVGLGTLAFLAFEWTNPQTIGRGNIAERLLDGVFSGVMPGTSGFGVFDYADIGQESLFVSDILMFVGGGSGGTAGGLKVATVALLMLVVWAELRGDQQVTAFRRAIPQTIQRQALTIATLLMGAVTLGTLGLMTVTDEQLGIALSVVIAAISTAGMSLDLQDELTTAAKMILIPLMLLGRIGPLALGSMLILRDRQRRYAEPEERIMVV